MARQLIFTSAPAGLTPGRTGFCTVARQPDLRERLVPIIEGFSQYPHDWKPAPVICAFRLVDVGDSRFAVLTRLVETGHDYTQRTNFLAHHLIFDATETSTLPAPAEFFVSWPGWLQRWDGPPRWLGEADLVSADSLTPSTESILPARTWEQVAGDAGYAGLLLNDSLPALAFLQFRPDQEGDVLHLIRESSALLASDEAWRTEFIIGLQPTEAVGAFKWVAQRADVPANSALSRFGINLDLTQPASLPLAPINAVTRRARTTTEAVVTPANANPPPAATIPPLLLPLTATQPLSPAPVKRQTLWWAVGAVALFLLIFSVFLLCMWIGHSFTATPKLANATAEPFAQQPASPSPATSPPDEPTPDDSASSIRAIAAPSQTTTPTAPSLPNSARGRLQAVQGFLKRAHDALASAPPANHGGYLDNALAELAQAQSDVTAGLAFIKANPKSNPLTQGQAPADASSARVATVPDYDKLPNGRNRNPRMVTAINNLNKSLAELLNGEPGSVGPVLGEIGGYRDKIIKNAGQAASDVVAAMDFEHGTLTQPAPKLPPGVPPLAPADKMQTWTNTKQQTIQAEQIGYDAQNQTVKLRMANGSIYDYPVNQLTPADASRAKAWTQVPPASTGRRG